MAQVQPPRSDNPRSSPPAKASPRVSTSTTLMTVSWASDSTNPAGCVTGVTAAGAGEGLDPFGRADGDFGGLATAAGLLERYGSRRASKSPCSKMSGLG